MKRILGLVGIMGCLLSACGEPTPLQKLASHALLDDMNPTFWGKEQEQTSPLWQSAMAYCDQHEEKPNCAVIHQLRIFAAGNKVIPTYGSSRQTITLYDFKAHQGN